jgi:formate dehydrogenase subunit gamma
MAAAQLGDIIRRHQDREGPALVVLQAIQAEYGYIPEEAVPEVAAALNLSRAEIHGLVTFYHDFRRHRAGRHVLKLCRAEACQAMGAERLAAHAQARLGVSWHETTSGGGITLEPVFCLGLCACAPAALLDEVPLGRLDAPALDAALDGLA